MSSSSQAGVHVDSPPPESPGLPARLLRWGRRVNLERKLAILLLIGTVASGTVTFSAMTDHLPMAVEPRAVLLLLNLDLILLLGLSALIARRLVILWAAHKKGLAGSHLHARLVALFSIVAVTPTIVIATFSVLLFDFGLQGWFSERVRTAVTESREVARSYLEEHKQTINADALAMAQDLNRQGLSLSLNPQLFNQVLTAQAALRSLTEAVVFDSAGRVLGRAGFSLLLDFDPEIPDWAMQRAGDGEVVILTAETDDRVRALLRLDNFTNAFLYVGRLIEPRVLGHIESTESAVKAYEELEGKRSDLQVTFALIFVVVSLMLLLAAIWVGLAFATRLSRPIGGLIDAAERVASGDLTARVDPAESLDEIDTLAKAFNRMTGELESQRHELLDANRQLDLRSRFIEAVLGGVSAGVIGLNRAGEITLPNRSACDLLDMTEADLRGRKLVRVVPEMAELLQKVRRRPQRLVEHTVGLERGEAPRRLLVRIAAETDAGSIIGFVVTFDDITELLSAQRKAAWADVARRIAHEIKNPLTPIQLSAERLKRKYLAEIRSDPVTFENCTNMIVRHVSDIGRMVDEFSAFARMPAPVMAEENLVALMREAMFLQQSAHPDIAFSLETPEGPVVANCDREQIGRALTNLLQNAVDALAGRAGDDGATLPQGRVALRLIEQSGAPMIEIEDNGPGLPRRDRHRLTEPYVTTRVQGTGLGLAIVKKIMEDHGGDLILADGRDGGARVRLLFGTDEDMLDAYQKKATLHGT
jgi:two-component system nitrogen regulation sensor histidine kinase NtrY